MTRAPLKGASVFLIGTTVVATIDDRVRFTMTGVPAGEHTLTFSHILLDSAGVQAPQFPIRVGADTKVRFVDGVRWFSITSPAIVELDRYVTTHEPYGIEVYGGGAGTSAPSVA